MGKGLLYSAVGETMLFRNRKEDVEEFLCVRAALNTEVRILHAYYTMVNIESRSNMPGIANEFTQRS